MHRLSILFFFFLASVLFTTCQRDTTISKVKLPGGEKVHLLSKEDGRKLIVIDQQEHFFEFIQPIDISIQLKTKLKEDLSREAMIAQYKTTLQNEVMDFTYDDTRFLNSMIRQAGRFLHQFHPGIMPQEIGLIKIKGELYGPSVFYTRENNIIIPEAELKKQDESVFLRILLHEIFHIYSREHPHKREELYAALGFEKIADRTFDLDIPDVLKEYILLNPDGINCAYKIDLTTDSGEEISVIPLITSRFHHYGLSQKERYFSHLSFSLYPIRRKTNGQYVVESSPEGQSPLNFWELRASFMEKVGRHTAYIIHPDEILADYFTLLIMIQYADDTVDEPISGLKDDPILNTIKSILQNQTPLQ